MTSRNPDILGGIIVAEDQVTFTDLSQNDSIALIGPDGLMKHRPEIMKSQDGKFTTQHVISSRINGVEGVHAVLENKTATIELASDADADEVTAAILAFFDGLRTRRAASERLLREHQARGGLVKRSSENSTDDSNEPT